MTDAAPIPADRVRGDTTRLMIPTHPAALREGGAGFLTAAFHACGSLPADNAVARITRFAPFVAGSSGDKAMFSVEYVRPDPALPTDLFAKFSRNFSDPFHDRRCDELESEIALYRLAQVPGFPVRVPSFLFGDMARASATGLLITGRIPFGREGVEPLHGKCMDHALDDPLDHYRAIVTALARLAAAHRSGALGDAVEAVFPFDAAAAARDDPIPWSEDELRDRVARYAAFAHACPQLLPARLTTSAFLARLEVEAVAVLRTEAAIKRHLHGDPDHIALGHFNANIDNAWFWRDAAGRRVCGLFDWQRARQMNVAYALWGGLCAAGLDLWERHLDELLALFVSELRDHGGPSLDVAMLRRHLTLYAMTIGLAQLLDAPAVVLAQLPGAVDATGPLDPCFQRSEGARCFLHVFTIFLHLWEEAAVPALLGQVRAEAPGASDAVQGERRC